VAEIEKKVFDPTIASLRCAHSPCRAVMASAPIQLSDSLARLVFVLVRRPCVLTVMGFPSGCKLCKVIYLSANSVRRHPATLLAADMHLEPLRCGPAIRTM